MVVVVLVVLVIGPEPLALRDEVLVVLSPSFLLASLGFLEDVFLAPVFLEASTDFPEETLEFLEVVAYLGISAVFEVDEFLELCAFCNLDVSALEVSAVFRGDSGSFRLSRGELVFCCCCCDPRTDVTFRDSCEFAE